MPPSGNPAVERPPAEAWRESAKLREPRRRSCKSDWQLADLIDFECLLEADRDTDSLALRERDHAFYRRIMEEENGGVPHKPAWNRRWLFRRWLELRREILSADQVLPGVVFTSARRAMNEILIVLGVLIGAGTAATLLRYDGVQPVNVAAFLGWLVLGQLALAGAAMMVLVLRRAGCFFTEISLVTGLVRWAWVKLATGLARRGWERLSAARRLDMQAFFGRIAGRRSLFGEVALWPLAGTLHWFGIWFNTGALATTLLLVVFSDRAFGWQSAMDFQSTQIHAFVQWLARPWTWIWPQAVPSLEQIMGSKIVLKDGIKQLATENLVSWWPFLCLALATYGLLPRFFLWLAALGMGRVARQRVNFRHVSCDRLHERMTGPIVQTSGENVSSPGLPPRERTSLSAGCAEDFGMPPDAARSALLLVPEDLVANLGVDPEWWRSLLAGQIPWLVRDACAWPSSSSAQAGLIGALAERLSREGAGAARRGLILLEESWQPPIAEKLRALRALRAAAGDETPLMILLLGRPGGEALWTVPRAVERSVWEKQVASLGDDGIRVEPWNKS